MTKFPRKPTSTRRSHMAVVVLANEAVAFQAYRLLQYHGISPEHLAIVGAGYSSPERVGLLEPMQIALKKARHFALLMGPLGATLGLIGFLVLHLGLGIPESLQLWLLIPMLAIMGGFCGSVIGALFGLLGEGSVAGIYRHYLRQGRYLLMIEGPESVVQWSQEVLGQYVAPQTQF